MSDTREKIVSSYVSFYEGYEEKALTSVDAIFSDQSSGLWKPETNTFMDFLTLKSLYHSEDWVFILVDRIASKISSQYLRVMKDEVVDGKKVSRPAEGHPAQAIIDAPNEVQDYHTWMYSLVADDCILGNSFQWFSKSLGQIIPIPGENVRPFFDGKGQLTKYIIVQHQEDGIQPKSWSLNVDEICHIRRANPSSMYVGLSPFVAAQKSLLFSRYSAEYLNNFYIKGAQPGIVLEMGAEANQEMALRLLRSMENAYTGRRNQRRSMVLPRGVKATQLSTTIADQQLIDLINQNREKIINILQVPKHELSIAETGSLGSEDYKTAIKNFWRGPLRNTMRRVAGSLALKMKDALGEGYYLEFDLSDVEYLADDERTKAEAANLMLQTHTLNEVRSKVYDMKPLAEGDKAPGAVPQASPIQVYGLPKPETAMTIDAVPLDVMDTKAIDRVDLFLKSNGGKWWERRQEIETEGQKIAQEKMSMLALALLGDQVNAAVKAIKGKKAAPTEAELRKRIKEVLAEMEQDYVDGFGEALSGTVEFGYDAALQLPFDLPNKDALNAIRSRNERRRYSLLEARGIDSFDSVSKTTTDKIMRIIGDEMAKSASIKEIADSIMVEFSDKLNAARALRIARTESLMAQSIGQAAAMKDVERSTGEKIYKMWVNAGDERVRGNPGGLYPNAEHDHWVLQGQVRPSSKSFSNGLMFPRDPSGEAGDVINCFPADTFVHGLEVEKLFSRIYSGPMVTINFKSGDKLTGTPNHPVLTPKGWIAIGSLAKGSKVFKASGFDYPSVDQVNIKYVKSTFAEMLSSFSESGNFVRKSGAVMDFHGDGTTENVDIIDIERTLVDGIKSGHLKETKNFDFTDTNFAHGVGLSNCGELESIDRRGFSHSGVGSEDLLSSSVDVENRPFQSLSGAPVSLPIASLIKSFDDGSSGEVCDPANLQNGKFLVEVHVDEVVGVDVVSYHGYVYNLQTKGGYYIANKTVVHNCRCTWLMVPASEKDRLGDWKDELNTEG